MLKSHPDKFLYEHLLNVAKNSKNKILDKKLNLTIIEKKYIAEISYIIGIAHDFGKASYEWQKKLNNNEKPPPHSRISAVFGLVLVENIFNGNKNLKLFKFLIYIIIQSHHGNLKKIVMERYRDIPFDKLNRAYDDIVKDNVTDIYSSLLKDYNIDITVVLKNLKKYIENNSLKTMYREFERISDSYKNDEEKIELFLLVNFLFSVLIDSDKKDAAGLSEDICKSDNSLIKDDFVDKYIEYCKKTEPDKFNPDLEINKLKNMFYAEATQNNELSIKNKIYLLTAPTGIGKTFTAYSTALKLKSRLDFNAKIIYCLPYTSIIDQNFDEIEKILKYNLNGEYDKNSNKYLLKHHHLADIKINIENYTSKSFLDDHLLVESWDSANIVSTFVQFFHSVIGYKNSFLKKFHNIVNSIVILDEIQQFPLAYRNLLNKILNVFAEKFNTYFILMTATQPLIFSDLESIKLANPEKYFSNSIFNRVVCNINLNPMTIEDFEMYFYNTFDKKKNSCLIVMNTRDAAVSLFKQLNKSSIAKEYKIYSLTNLLIPIHITKRINNIKEDIKNKNKVIVISTQLIEAGVDLSFEIVYRDFAPIDSIVQVAGRCNRYGEFKNKGEMKVVCLHDNGQKYSNRIYNRKILSITEELMGKEIYESKDFYWLSKEYFSKMKFNRESRKLLAAIDFLNYDIKRSDQIPIEYFKIIEDEFQVLLFFMMDDVAIETFNEFLSAEEIQDKWERKEIIDKCKKIISRYSINVYMNDLLFNKDLIDNYTKNREHEYTNSDFYYVKKENIKNLYDSDIGYIKGKKEIFITKFV